MTRKLKVSISMMMIMTVLLMAMAAYNTSDIASANDSSTGRTVTVSGQGEIVVTPDLAYIDLGVQTKAVDATKAQQENAKLMTTVIDALKKQGIKAEDIKTTNYSIYQTYDYKSNGERGDAYYVVNNTVNVKILDVTKVGNVIDAATLAGANSVNSIRFTVKDDSKYYQDALKLAMTNAKGKATAIMSTFGKTPGLPSAVNESSSGGGLYYDYYPSNVKMDMAFAESTPIESGEIKITANVTVSYDY